MEYGLYNKQELQYSFTDLINMGVFKIKDGYILNGAYVSVSDDEECDLTEEDIEYFKEHEEELEGEDDFNRFENKLYGVLVLPPYIKEIGNSAFCSLSNISKIVLPENLEIIRASAFASSGIEEIQIPNNVKIIEDCAFYGCRNLKEITLPDNIKILGRYNFAPADCKIKYRNIVFNSVLEMHDITSKKLDNLLDTYNLRTINAVKKITFCTEYDKEDYI